MNDPIWRPSPQRVQDANITRYLQQIQREVDRGVDSYSALWQWSVDAPAQFWPTIWRYCGVRAEREWESVMEPGRRMQDTRWFCGSRLNFAENLLRFDDDRPALVFRNEREERRAWSYAELRHEVARLAAGLRADGVETGDRVAGFMANTPETVAGMLATTSIGAIWTSCSPDFASNAVLDRFGQVEPKVLFAHDGYYYKGKSIDIRETTSRLSESIASVERVVTVPYLALESPAGLEKATCAYDAYGDPDAPLRFEPLPFDHPLYVLYSSGTTGPPKCIVHGAGGTLLQHLKELKLHTDIGRGDRVFYFTTCGWMMWNWLVSALALGATVHLYDGSPFYPDAGVLPRMAAQEALTVFGVSAGYIGALEKASARPGTDYDLSPLKTVLSTGAPLLPEGFDYVYREVKHDVCLSSISGGTDIVSCFALGNPALPVHRGELQCRGLGMKVEVFDQQGRSVRGEKGELVCTEPFPSMPVGFWNDPDGSRYNAAYFERFPGVWHHGDYATLTGKDGLVIYGRSDAVLNPGGVRIGTAEIYRPVKHLPEVEECVAIGQQWRGDVRVVLFVQLAEGRVLDDELRDRIRGVIRQGATPRHVPAKVLSVSDVPRTRNAKIAEVPVRQVVHGKEVANTGALANPQALDEFRDRPELQSE